MVWNGTVSQMEMDRKDPEFSGFFSNKTRICTIHSHVGGGGVRTHTILFPSRDLLLLKCGQLLKLESVTLFSLLLRMVEKCHDEKLNNVSKISLECK